MDSYAGGLIATLLVSLRIGPTLMFAPPFTYLRVPASIRVLFGFALAAWLVAGTKDAALPSSLQDHLFIVAALSELILGVALSLCLQIAFAAILMAGRTIDFQVGFGLAVLADPSLRTQMPLIGTLLAQGAAAVFFLTGGPHDLMAIWSTSLEQIPVGAVGLQLNQIALLQFMTAAFVLAFGLAGLVILVLMIVDLAIAFLSRTLPQMNVLILGFQIKTIVLLVTLPLVFSLSGGLFLRIVRLAIETTPRLVT